MVSGGGRLSSGALCVFHLVIFIFFFFMDDATQFFFFTDADPFDLLLLALWQLETFSGRGYSAQHAHKRL